MGQSDSYTEAIELIDPENIDLKRVRQYSIEEKAKWFQSTIKRYDNLRTEMDTRGIKFGGRILLLGPPGTDFDSFVNYLATEVPFKIVRLRLNKILGDQENTANALQVGFEFAKRNSPCIFYLERLDTLCSVNSPGSAIASSELRSLSWDEDEVIAIASTTKPDKLDRELLSSFDRVVLSEGTSFDDRVRALEAILGDRKEFDPTLIGELTEGWGFNDVVHLGVSFFMLPPTDESQVTREMIEKLIVESGVLPFGKEYLLESLVAKTKGIERVPTERVESEYPDDFLDQLYLEAVGEDYTETQRIIDTLNSSLPLTTKDLELLTRFPFLLNGTPDERLMRLIKAKKSIDKLRRIMGRQ